ncbi:MAG: phage major capsid protein [Pseudonocardiaceae bacterium]|nr:phage major capsid protein [Pseudonocardiaceae bacterium]
MAFYTQLDTGADGDPILRPEDVHDLLIRPMTGASVAAQVCSVIQTGSTSMRLPYVSADPSAEWVEEGDEITPTDPTLGELDVVPTKIGGLTIISNELALDSDPAANTMVGQGLARDIARRVDEAFFSTVSSPAPEGLDQLSGVTAVDAGGDWENLDWAAEAINNAEDENTVITAFVTSPADALLLAQLKDETDSNRHLLQPDPTRPTRRMVAGVPLWVSRYVTEGTVWGIPQDRTHVVIRTDATIAVSTDAYFSSDRVGVRGTMRVAFGFPHAAAIQEVTLSG